MDIDRVNDSVELAWTENVPFADWSYLRQRVTDSVRRRLELVQQSFPQATPVLEQLDLLDNPTSSRILGHPFLRALVLAAFRHLKEPWEVLSREQIAGYFEELGSLLAEGWRGGDLSSLSPLLVEDCEEDAAPQTLWQWTGEQEDQNLTGITCTVFLQNSPNCVFRPPTEEESDNLRQGIALLHLLLPTLTPSVLRHVDVIALISSKTTTSRSGSDINPLASDPLLSSSGDTSPGVIFVSPSILTNPWYVAEIVLHEGLHLKLYDVMATHSLLRPNYTNKESAEVHPLWHRSSVSWDVHRSIFAMHVYAHLALFFQRVERNFDALASRFGPLHIENAHLSTRRSLDRAYFLRMKLAEIGMADMGPAGRLLLAQIQEMLQELDEASKENGSVDGSSRHGEVAQRLVGDFYSRQTMALERVLAHWPTISSHPQVARIPEVLTEVAQLDAALAGLELDVAPAASAGVEDTLKDLIHLRKQVAHDFMNGGASPSLETLLDSASRSGGLFARASITVDLDP